MRKIIPTPIWEDFKVYIQSHNGILLDTLYRGRNKPYHIQCSHNHIFTLIPNNLYICYKKNQSWCHQCRQFEKFKNYVKTFNVSLLSTEWVGYSGKYQLQCPQGHIFTIKPSSLYMSLYNKYALCRKCGDLKRRKSLIEYHNKKGRIDRDGTSESSRNRFNRIFAEKESQGHIIISTPHLSQLPNSSSLPITPKDACKMVQCNPCVGILENLCMYNSLPPMITSQPNFDISLANGLLDYIKNDQTEIIHHIREVNKILHRTCHPSRPSLICAVAIYDYYQINYDKLVSQELIAQIFHTTAVSVRKLWQWIGIHRTKKI